MERDRRVQVSTFLGAGKTPTEMAKQLNVEISTIYCLKKKLDINQGVERKSGSAGKYKLEPQLICDVIQRAPTTSMRAHAKDLGVGESRVRRAVKECGGKSLVMFERPLLTPQIKVTHLQRCKGLINDLKSAPAGKIIISVMKRTGL
ncbi:Uncharacterized protein FKW44_018264, partial [Caligus rogercresseyi]